MDKTIEERSVLSEGNSIGFWIAEEVDPNDMTPGLGNL